MDSTPESREAATNGYKTYLRGLTRQQVFTPLNGKAAYLPEWQKNPVRLKEVPEGKNVGLLLEHAGLTDVDLDCAEVQYTVPVFLDSDTLGVGRGGKIRRYLYEGAADRIYTDLDNTTKLLEVRHKAKQFMCPPSIHPDTGEPVEWIKGMPPIPLPDEETIHKAATSALIARHLPAGGRHDLAMAYAGFLLRKGLQEQEVFDILWTAWELSNPSRDADRDLWNIVKDTAEKIAQDKPATGGNTLTRMIPGMTDKISEYWGWDQLLTHEEKIEQERQERIQRARDAWPKCEGLAHDSDILSNIYNLIKADGLIGEETNAKLLTLGAVSLLRGEPISAIVKGTSSVGKSEVIKRATKALPPEMIVERQSMSERALAYMGKDRLKSKILVVYELGGLGTEGKESLEMAKQILSEGCIKRQIAEGTNKGVHGKLVEVDGPTALWTTTTRVKTDYELSNRVFELSPDDSRAQTRSIIKNVFEDDRNEVDFGPVKALFTWIAGQDNRVVIPFGSALGDLLPDSSVRMRREAIRVRNLICAHAVLHQASRERDERDRIVATLEDYEAVRRLVEDIVGATAEKSVRPEVRETVEAAQTLIESEEHDHAGVTISEMEARLNRDYSTTSRRMKAASPYLVELEEKRGRSKQFAIGVDLPAEANVLPTVDEVCKFACVCGSGGAEAEHDGNCAVSARKIRANVRANFDEYVPVDDDKTHILGENSDQHEGEPTESGLSENYLQTCKLHDGDCPTPELCVQNCANFAGDILKDEHAALIARMIRSHANKCKLHGRVIPDNFIDWQRELYKEYDFEASFEDLALGFEYIGAENEEWRATVRALESIEIVQESTDVAYAYDAIQEIRNDLQGYKKLPTDAESWHRILEVNDKPCTLETIEAALALAG